MGAPIVTPQPPVSGEPRPTPELIPAAHQAGSFRMALCQVAPILGGLDRNLEQHLAQIAQARAAEADLIVFPELSLTGYFLRDMVPELALPREAPQLDRLAEAAGEGSVVYGFVELSRQQRYYNSAAFVEAGRTSYVHRKVYLPTYGLFDESRYFAAGHRIRAFDTERFGRVGLLICEDFWHISAAAIMQAEEVDLLICCANSPARGVQGDRIETAEVYDRTARTYAQLLGCIVVVVNRVGYEDGLCFWGGSFVVGPDGETIAVAPSLEESLTYADIDVAELRRERTVTPLARDERLLVTLEELKRIRRERYAD